MKNKEALYLGVRYFALVLLGALSLNLFYIFFTPLTVYPVFWVISLFDSSAKLLAGNVIFFEGFYAEIIPACVAGAAYYLLLILNLTTPMDPKTRTKSIAFLLLAFLAINVARILFFAGLVVVGYQFFDIAHQSVWYFGSTILVVLLWFTNVWLFKIKEIPIYSDIKNIFSDIKKPQRN